MNPSNAPPQVCMFTFSQSKKNKLRKVRACSIKTLRSHGIQESAHFVLFTWSLLYLISDWVLDPLFTSVMYSPSVAFLIEAAAAHGLLILFWLSRSLSAGRTGFVLAVQIVRTDLKNRVISPVIYVHLPSRPQNRNNQTLKSNCSHSNYYPPYFAKCTHGWLTRSHDQIRSV